VVIKTKKNIRVVAYFNFKKLILEFFYVGGHYGGGPMRGAGQSGVNRPLRGRGYGGNGRGVYQLERGTVYFLFLSTSEK